MKKLLLATMLFSMALVSCSDKDNDAPVCNLTVTEEVPLDGYSLMAATLTFEEINTGRITTFDYPLIAGMELPVGVYNISGEMTVSTEDGICHLRTNQYQRSLTGKSKLVLKWIMYNPNNTLVFGEIYFTGSLNAKGTGGLYDSFFTIYNNTDEVLYADGLAIVESKFLNTTTDQILTAANNRDVNFTVQTVYVIPGSGTDVPVMPGQSIKIADQAIDWTEQMPNALDHRDADFEWYDESSSTSVKDTDNPAVPNLDKWYSYSPTIWLPSNQCNRSYALVRFPEGMTMDRFLTEQKGDYTYVNAATGKEMSGTKCYLIKPEWIIDGVNLCPTEKFTEPALPMSIDSGYAAISDKNADTNRFGKKFARKVSGVTAKGNTILQDTDNSSRDFEVVIAK